MSFVDDFDDVTRAVARLLARQYVVPPADLEAATAGHGALVQLLQQLHQDVTGLSPHAAHGRGVGELERHPVALLGRLLADQPRLPSGALTDLLASHRSPQQLLWTDLARTATLAHHEWTTSDPRSYPTGDGAWTVVGAVARIAEVLPALDDDLSASFEAAGREVEALQLRKAGHGGLAPTAREVAALAGAGSDGPIELVPREPRQVIVVLRPSDLPAAMRRAASLIDGSRHLSPQHLERLAVAHARTMLWIADGLEGRTAGAEAAALRQDAHLVAQAARMPRRLASIQPSDAEPLAQLSQIRQALVDRDARRLPAATLMNMAASSPAVTMALANAARAMAARGSWLAPSESGVWMAGRSSDPSLASSMERWSEVDWSARRHAQQWTPPRHAQALGHLAARSPAAPPSVRRPDSPTASLRGLGSPRTAKR
jgi:hypothetical protein